jgi:hypothetical protein
MECRGVLGGRSEFDMPCHRRGRFSTLLAAFALVLVLPAAIPAQAEARCDPIDPAVCLQPWPNDYFTAADPTTDTGKRLDLQIADMPRNVAGNPIRPDEWNRNDGFSPGQKITTKVPGLETQQAFQNTGAVPITDVERTYEPDQPIVVLNADTGERHLIWSELDANPADPADVNLIIRPAVNFEEGQRYIVGLRNLKNASGKTIKANHAFRIYRDRLKSNDAVVEARRAHMERLFSSLARAGIARKSLFLAWDFTVASQRNLSERILSIRDDAFSQLGDTNLSDLQVQGAAPQFAVTGTTDFAPCGTDGCQSGEDAQIARQVSGNVVVPCYLNAPGCPPGSRMTYLPGSTVPQRIPGNTHAASFTCLIPRVAVDGAEVVRARPSLYGHGLLGSASEITAGNIKAMSNEHNFVFCATDWSGMSTQDLPNIGTILADLSNFSSLPDRAQQGFVNFMYLGRLMIHPNGFNSNAAFQFTKGGLPQPVIDTTRLFYDGNSQGGIMGGSLTAVAPDFNRAVLGVPGMNYSTLLRRSVDFDEYAQLLYPNYPNELERPLILSLIQTLWDRGEANGYAHHMTDDPYPNTPAHNVLLHVAFGDHQVAPVTAEVEARTIGAHVRVPATDPGRHSDVNPFFGIPPIGSFPFGGSALVIWDSGSPTPPPTNTPPRAGRDPHSDPRSEPSARVQKSEFLKVGGQVVDVCGPKPCYARGYTGTSP